MLKLGFLVCWCFALITLLILPDTCNKKYMWWIQRLRLVAASSGSTEICPPIGASSSLSRPMRVEHKHYRTTLSVPSKPGQQSLGSVSRYLVTRTTSWLYVWYKYKVHIWTLTPTSNPKNIWISVPFDPKCLPLTRPLARISVLFDICYRSRERWEQRMGSYEYWLISAPGDKTCQQTFEKLNQVTV